MGEVDEPPEERLGAVWRHAGDLEQETDVEADDPAALPNYLARGFRRVREECYTAEIDDAPMDPPERPSTR